MNLKELNVRTINELGNLHSKDLWLILVYIQYWKIKCSLSRHLYEKGKNRLKYA